MVIAQSRPVVLVTGADLAAQAREILADYELVFAGAKPTESDLIELVCVHDPIAIIVRYGKITSKIIDAAQSLRVISKHGSGIDTIDQSAAQVRGIAVRAAAGANAAAVAEHAMTLLLACSKSVVHLNARTHSGHWDKSTHKSIELNGRTLGLVGLGAIGRRVAAFAHAMEMRVVGFDPFASQLPDYIESVSLEQIWYQSDAISLHCPLNDENRDLINSQTLSHCKDGVILVNTARGGLIVEQDLLAAIRSGKVFSAGIDSFQQEPPPADHPFFFCEQIILSPHIGGVTGEAYIKMGVGAAENILGVINHEY
jgi:D-3-phosphoglycerate dehydrogenase